MKIRKSPTLNFITFTRQKIVKHYQYNQYANFITTVISEIEPWSWEIKMQLDIILINGWTLYIVF